MRPVSAPRVQKSRLSRARSLQSSSKHSIQQSIKITMQQIQRKRTRTSRKCSIDRLQRNRKFIKSAKSTHNSSSHYITQQPTYIPLNLTYNISKPQQQKIDYSHLYFPARYKYVKTCKKTPQSLLYFNTHDPLFDKIKVILDQQKYYHQTTTKQSHYGQTFRNHKFKVNYKPKLKGVIRKFQIQNKEKQEQPGVISPWDTDI